MSLSCNVYNEEVLLQNQFVYIYVTDGEVANKKLGLHGYELQLPGKGISDF